MAMHTRKWLVTGALLFLASAAINPRIAAEAQSPQQPAVPAAPPAPAAPSAPAPSGPTPSAPAQPAPAPSAAVDPQNNRPGRVVATVTALEGSVHVPGVEVELQAEDGLAIAKTLSDTAG